MYKRIEHVDDFEKQLLSLSEYSFSSYTTLKLINFKLMDIINHLLLNCSGQLLIDLAFEIDQELDGLRELRYVTDKNAALKNHLQITLSILTRLKSYVFDNSLQSWMVKSDLKATFLNMIKKRFRI